MKKSNVTLKAKPTVKKAVHGALAADQSAKHHLKAAGAVVAQEWPSRDELDKVRAQFTAEYIRSAPRYAEEARILSIKLPRANGNEYDAWIKKHSEAAFVETQKLQANARSTLAMAYKLIADYAFPVEDKPRAISKKKLHVAMLALIDGALKRCANAENAAFDVVEFSNHLRAARAVLPQPVKPTKAESGRRDVKAPKASKLKKARANKSTLPGTVGLGDAKQSLAGVKPRRAKAKPSGKRDARDMMGTVG